MLQSVSADLNGFAALTGSSTADALLQCVVPMHQVSCFLTCLTQERAQERAEERAREKWRDRDRKDRRRGRSPSPPDRCADCGRSSAQGAALLVRGHVLARAGVSAIAHAACARKVCRIRYRAGIAVNKPVTVKPRDGMRRYGAGYPVRLHGIAAATGRTTCQARRLETGIAAAGTATETGIAIVTATGRRRRPTGAAETGTAAETTGTGTASAGRAAGAATGSGIASASGRERSTAMAVTSWMTSTSRTRCVPSSA